MQHLYHDRIGVNNRAYKRLYNPYSVKDGSLYTKVKPKSIPDYMTIDQVQNETYDSEMMHGYIADQLGDRFNEPVLFEHEDTKPNNRFSRSRLNLLHTGLPMGEKEDTPKHPEMFIGFMDDDRESYGLDLTRLVDYTRKTMPVKMATMKDEGIPQTNDPDTIMSPEMRQNILSNALERSRQTFKIFEEELEPAIPKKLFIPSGLHLNGATTTKRMYAPQSKDTISLSSAKVTGYRPKQYTHDTNELDVLFDTTKQIRPSNKFKSGISVNDASGTSIEVISHPTPNIIQSKMSSRLPFMVSDTSDSVISTGVNVHGGKVSSSRQMGLVDLGRDLELTQSRSIDRRNATGGIQRQIYSDTTYINNELTPVSNVVVTPQRKDPVIDIYQDFMNELRISGRSATTKIPTSRPDIIRTDYNQRF